MYLAGPTFLYPYLFLCDDPDSQFKLRDGARFLLKWGNARSVRVEMVQSDAVSSTEDLSLSRPTTPEVCMRSCAPRVYCTNTPLRAIYIAIAFRRCSAATCTYYAFRHLVQSVPSPRSRGNSLEVDNSAQRMHSVC